MKNTEVLLQDILNKRRKISVERLDMSYGEIISNYEMKELIIDPEFQRLFRWSEYQQTRFIESILLGIPIPPIYVAEDEEGRWELVDGLQRISTVLSFYGTLRNSDKNKWKLDKGELVESIKSFGWDDLPLKLQLNIKRAYCRVEVIKAPSDMDIRFELFNRLNTGGSKLTDQEIRNCIYRGTTTKFNNMLKELSKNENFQTLIQISDNQLELLYDEELVLRFISLYNKWEEIESPIGNFMTHYMQKAVHNSDYDYQKMINIFKRTFDLLVFYEDMFKARNHYFSTSLFEGIAIPVARDIETYEKIDKKTIKEKIDKIRGNKEFQKYMGSAAASKARVKKRLGIGSKMLAL